MKTVNFIFGIHNHQPVGNFNFVIEDAFQKSYRPFIEVVEEFPDLHISFHFSGCLLEWLEQHHPEYLDRITALVARGNVEILSGGFFEPVLAMIPDRDKLGQIQMMNDYIRTRFHYSARGLWLTERVWEPHLAKPIADAGIQYVTVDDYHFLGAGKQARDLTGHFITEEQGKTLSIFPISQKLRYAIPFKEPQETVDYLQEFVTEDGRNAVVMADDGEKFGVWPGTHETVFENDWLHKFFNLLQQNQEWVKTLTFAEYYNNHPPKGRIYLPTASYFEMSEWALPWEAGEQFDDLVKEFEQQDRFEKIKPFIKGGIWRNFLFKYNESNWMQKKMLHLSDRLDAICPKKLSKIQQQIWQTAREHLWRSMCNCAYWHGIFGGLYLPHLRHAVYVELLSCEARLNQLEYHNGFVSEELDVDGDGEDEILITFGDYHCAFVPHNGAILVELSLLDKHYNVLNSLQRYKEAYHRKVLMAGKKSAKGSIHENIAVKEEGLAKYLKYDLYPRKNLIDHIIKPSVTLEQFRNCEYYEDSDLIAGRYDYEVNKRGKSICFTKDGWINWQPVFVQKEIFFLQRGLKIRYRFKNTGTQPNSFRFGPEFNFAMLGGNTPDRFYQQNEKRLTDSALNSSGILEQSNALSVVNDWDKFMITIKTTENADFWRFPIETVSLSEAGFERVYQSSVVVPFFSVYLIPEESRSIELELLIKSW